MIGAWLTLLAPATTMPSTGIRSPGRTTTAVANLKLGNRHGDFLAIATHRRGLRRQVQQVSNAAARLVQRVALQRPDHRHDEDDDRCRPELSDRNRRGKRHEHEYVDRDPAAKDILEPRNKPLEVPPNSTAANAKAAFRNTGPICQWASTQLARVKRHDQRRGEGEHQ